MSLHMETDDAGNLFQHLTSESDEDAGMDSFEPDDGRPDSQGKKFRICLNLFKFNLWLKWFGNYTDI